MGERDPEPAPEIAEDALYGGRVRLRQFRGGHRAGTDAVLLAAALRPAADHVVADIGAGTGAVGLMVAARSGANLVLVEKDPSIAALCRENVALNGLAGRAQVIEADVMAFAADREAGGLAAGTADAVVTNPPFLEAGRSRPSRDAGRAAAHVLAPGGLQLWLAGCADLLKPKGRLALIHRADRLDECLQRLSVEFGAVALRVVHPRSAEPAIRVVLTAVKGRRGPLTIRPPLILHDSGGGFTPEAAALHQGEGWLM